MKLFLQIILSVIIFSSLGNNAHAASSKLVLFVEETVTIEDEYGEYEETHQVIIHNIEDGGTYAVDLNREYRAYLASDIAVHFSEGYLYRINGDNSRELISQVGGYDSLTWNQAGKYEIDFYDTEPPILGQISPLESFLAYILPNIAYAQSPALFLETIHFTITDENAVAECCSSVVFLPGIKGSVLKTGQDTLWPPTIWSTDVSQLALTEDGQSINDVFVDGMLSTFYGTPIYDGFGSFMNTLVADETIADWEPLPYDWRFSPEKILENGVKTSDGVTDLIEKIEQIAENSNTGQVTIVAHSMGGLMGKAIINQLEEEGKADLIDSFVMVGSPQLGTPQAIGGMLHGDGESILAGRIVDSGISRMIAQNMPASYNILPSRRYFEEVTDPVITFRENDWYTDEWIARWGKSLDTYDEYSEFLTGQGVSRTDPLPGMLSIPEILQSELVNQIASFHNEYDTFAFPEHIRVVQVAGWGQPTVNSIEYRSRHLLFPSYEPGFTIEGDSTVIYQSAASSDVDETYFFNQNKLDTFEHTDLVSAQPVQDLIQLIVQEKVITDTEFLTSSKPESSEVNAQLLVSSHSPVILGVWDSEGNFTGIDPEQDLNSAFLISEDIPSSAFMEFGDSQYIFLKKEGVYTFSYKGTGTGSTTVEIETFSNDARIPVVTFTDIPTNPNTLATFEVDSSNPEDAQIKVDQNGDGTIDSVVKADGTELTLEELIALLKTSVSDLALQKALKRSLLTKVFFLEKALTIQNETIRQFSVSLALRAIKFEVELLLKGKKIPEQEAAIILELLTKIKEKI